MSLMHVSSPHVHKPVSSVEQVMKQVCSPRFPAFWYDMVFRAGHDYQYCLWVGIGAGV